jgi:hypothetical protein
MIFLSGEHHSPRNHIGWRAGGGSCLTSDTRRHLAQRDVAGLGSNFLTLLATTVIISGYAIGLGFQARGMPDVIQISAFADQIAPMATLVLLIAFTLIAGWSVAGRPPPQSSSPIRNSN